MEIRKKLKKHGKKIVAGITTGIVIAVSLYIMFQPQSTWHSVNFPGGYVFTYRKISEYQGLTEFNERFEFYLNKNHTITSTKFLKKVFQRWKGNEDVYASGYYLIKQVPYQTGNHSSPIYGNVTYHKDCHGSAGVNYGIINSSHGWCNDSNCLLNCTNCSECYYEHYFDWYATNASGVRFFWKEWEVVDYENMTAYREKKIIFNPIGKTIVGSKVYTLELWAKKKLDLSGSATYINISIFGKELKGMTWWNTTAYPYANEMHNFTSNYAYVANGSSGFCGSYYHYLAGGGQVFIAKTTTGCGESITIVNETEEVPWVMLNSSGVFGHKTDEVYSGAVLVMPFNENSGNQTTDCSGNENNGTCYGAGGLCNWTTGRFGHGIDFDGTDDYIDCGNDSSLAVADTLTIELWVLYKTDGAGDGLLSKKAATYSGDGYDLYVHFTANLLDFMGDDGYERIEFDGGTTWHHIAVVFNSSEAVAADKCKMYVDGVFRAKSAAGQEVTMVSATTDNLKIGWDQNYGFFNSAIDEVRIYNRSLSAEEIMEHYQNGVGVGNRSQANGTELTASTAPNVIEFELNVSVAYTDTVIGFNATITDAENATLIVEWNITNASNSYEFAFGNTSGIQNNTNSLICNYTGAGKDSNVNFTIVRVFDTEWHTGYLNSSNITILDSAPTLPTLTTPVNTTNTTDNTPSFDWSDSTDADSDSITYEIQISDNSSFPYTNQSNSTLPASSYTATALENALYYWRVKAITSDANSSYTAPWIINISAYVPPPPPVAGNVRLVPSTLNHGDASIDCYFNVTGNESTMYGNVTWYVKQNQDWNSYVGGLITCTNNTDCSTIRSISGGAMLGHDYKCGVVPYNGAETGDEVNSSSLEVKLYVNSDTELHHQATYNVSSTGIYINASGVTLDCNGSTINYSQSSVGYGIDNQWWYDNINIRNCNIIQGNMSQTSSYGIYFRGVTGSNVTNCNISSSRFGFRIYSSSDSNTFTDNTISVTSYAIYIDTSSSNTFINNTISTSGSDGIYVYSSSSNTFTDNTISADSYGIDIRTSSSANQFINNTISVSGDYGVRLYDSDTNKFIDSQISSLTNNIYSKGTNDYTNYFLNCSFNKSKIGFYSGATDKIAFQWYLDVYVNDTIGDDLEDANVTAWNNDTVEFFSALTGSSGNIVRQNVTEYIQNVTAKYYKTNYTINTTLAGYTPDSQKLNITTNTQLNIELASKTIVEFWNESGEWETTNIGYLDFLCFPDTVDCNATNYTDYNPYLNTTNVIGWWHLDENTGNLTEDASSNENNGTIYGANWSTGRISYGLEFDGADDYVDCGNDSTLNFGQTESFTIEFWMKTNLSGSLGVQGLIEKGLGTNYKYKISHDVDNDRISVSLRSGVVGTISTVTGVAPISDGNWHHICIVRNVTDSKIYLYVNGTLDASGTDNTNATIGNTRSLKIGYVDDIYFNGTIDEIRILNRSLSASEVLYDYERGYRRGQFKVTNNYTSVGNLSISINESAPTGFSVYCDNQTPYSSPVVLTTSNQRIYGGLGCSNYTRIYCWMNYTYPSSEWYYDVIFTLD